MVDARKVMTADEYRRLFRGRRFDQRTIDIGHDIYVRGQSPAQVREKYGVGPKRLYAIRRQIEGLWVDEHMVPEGWVVQTVVAPREMLDQFIASVEAVRQEAVALNAAKMTRTTGLLFRQRR